MKKRKKLSKKNTLIISLIVLLISIVLFGYIIYTKYIVNDNEKEITSVVNEKVELENDIYDYYLSSNATKYQKELIEELKKVLSEKTVDEERYAELLSKIFISDLFSLDTKVSSSDITSSQYVYTDYQDTYVMKVKNTIYSNIAINLDGKRNQKLPNVTNVEIKSITRDSFEYNKQIIDKKAFYVIAKITYDKELDYPVDYKLVIVKNGDLLQVVKSSVA